ncbi:N-acetyldiaminopimelate deacetylase [subsurface metagenome]
MELEKLKKEIQAEVEAHRQELIDLSLKIHANPEVGWQEEKSSGWLADYLEKNGFKVERGICDLPTAFRARYGQGKPVIAIMAEYDALPGVGHGCGHNIIGTIAVGAGTAAKLAAEQAGGTILVFGTPTEECLGGKVVMAEKGAFDGIDAAMIVHPRGKYNAVGVQFLAMISLDVEFWGKSAHASSAPWDGINALEAMIQSFNGINSLRQHIKNKARIHGVITDGGKVANVIPEHSAGAFMVRATEDAYLDELREKVLNCFKAAALSTGARLEYRWGQRCSAMRFNSVLTQLWADNIQTLGRRADGFLEIGGSTDMGNVSVIVPSMHPFVAISPEPVPLHSTEFAAVAASDAGMEGLIDGAKALAMTAADVIGQPETLSRIKEEFLNTSK